MSILQFEFPAMYRYGCEMARKLGANNYSKQLQTVRAPAATARTKKPRPPVRLFVCSTDRPTDLPVLVELSLCAPSGRLYHRHGRLQAFVAIVGWVKR